jgi:DnaJ-class molecular chaperone
MSDAIDTTTKDGAGTPADPFDGASPYEILGVDRDADLAAIRSAFRRLTRNAADAEARHRLAGAFDALTRPRRRLMLDLLTPAIEGQHMEIVRRYGSVRMETSAGNVAIPMMEASDLGRGDLTADFEVPDVPRVVFESMLPAPLRGDELVVPDRRK